MARIIGVDGLTLQAVRQEVDAGARFVVFKYCISIVLVTLRQSSEIYFIRIDEKTISKSYSYILISLFLGWWGIPWGPIYTIGALATNLSGGKDVTAEVMSSLTAANPASN